MCLLALFDAQTTLAMSVMWALSGSMDARLVADGRAADVAYDASSYKAADGTILNSKNMAKRTAEVSLWGTINGKPFELVRRRGAKKSELLFSVDGRNLTTQSVKDTQLVVDQELGIGNGLLQRCCFFGQHSHTLQVVCCDKCTSSTYMVLIAVCVSRDAVVAGPDGREAQERAISDGQYRHLGGGAA